MMFRIQTIFILLLAAMTAFAQEAATFSTAVTLVKVDVQVTERGKSVSDLTRDDFVIFDEEAAREVVYFGREKEPLWLLLLLDASGSTRKHVKAMGDASREALQALRPGDRVGIMVFGRNTELRREFTEDFGAVSNAIIGAVNARGVGSGTRINASVIEAARYIGERVGRDVGRRALVILTDNTGLNYQVPNEAVLRALFEADTVLNAIAVGNAKSPDPPKPGANPDFTQPDVFLLARETGGEAIVAKKAGAVFGEILDRIRTRYSLHYAAPNGESGGFRRVRVALSTEARRRHPKAEIRARAGYYLP